MRIVAGSLRGRSLSAPPGDDTRPTTDKVREAIFNALGSLGVVHGATVVDLYAGTGALGLEALSRGARHATFVERQRNALAALRHNAKALGVEERTTVIAADAMATVPRLDANEGDVIVFVDPPYDFDRWSELFERLGAWERAPFVVAESGGDLEPPPPWEVVRSRRYGRTWVAFCEIAEQ